MTAHLSCVRCTKTYPLMELRYRCDCSGTLDVVHDPSQFPLSTATLDARRASRSPMDRSGVWRFRELILPLPESDLNDCVVTRGEGNTHLYEAGALGAELGVPNLWL